MTRRIFPMSDWAPTAQDGVHGGSSSSSQPLETLAIVDPNRTHNTLDASSDETYMVQSQAEGQAAPTSSASSAFPQQNQHNSLSRTRSMSLSFASWRHRPKSAVIPDDLFSRFSDMAMGSGSTKKHPGGSIDGLGFGNARTGAHENAAGPNTSIFNNHSVAQSSAIDDDLDGDEHDTGIESKAGPSHGSGGHPANDGKKALKGMIRRASVSIHGLMQRRPSFVAGKTAANDEATLPTASSSQFPPHWTAGSSQAYPQSSQAANAPVRPQPSSHVQAAHGASSLAHPNANSRPTTSHTFHSWRRLRQATSFRHSRVFDFDTQPPPPIDDPSSSQDAASGFTGGLPLSHARFSHQLDTVPSPREMLFFNPLDTTPHSTIPLSSSAPLTGGFSSMNSSPNLGPGPPVIPPNTGAAARAAAAAAFQQEMQHLQEYKMLHPEEYGNDHESGIGIAVSATEADIANGACDTADLVSDEGENSELGVVKIDFIEALPAELALAILSQLDAAGLATAARVSRHWSNVVQTQHIWRESFLREKTTTYATGGRVLPGTGLGVPPIKPSCDWRKIYRVKQELDRRWQEGKTRPVYLNGHSDSIYCLQFDESKIITGSRDKTIRIWDMHTLACRLVIGPPDVIHDSSLLYGEDGEPAHYITTAYHARSAYSMPAAVTFPMHHSASILCLQYDDRILVTGSSDASCIVYSVKSGYRPVRRLRFHSAAVLDLCFDEKHIVTCSKDISICVWDRETGAMLKQLRGHSGPVNAVQMRGNTVVSCSGDFRVKLWNLETGRGTHEFNGHTKGLACSQFSEDGRFVASAGNDKTIRIWDAHTGECVREMKAHENLVRSLHIDSVSGRLVSGSYDTDIKVFDMETGQQLLDFPRWHQSWVLSAKSDYRRIISTGQDPKILVMDFGAGIDGIEMLESVDCRSDSQPFHKPDVNATGALIEGDAVMPANAAGYI